MGFSVRNCTFENNANPSKAGLELSSKNGIVESCSFFNNWVNIFAKAGTENVSLRGMVGCNKSFLYGICDTQGYTLSDSDCDLPVAKCQLPDEPYAVPQLVASQTTSINSSHDALTHARIAYS